MMLTRRTMLAATAAATLPAGAAFAETWQAKYPELTFAVVPAENASGVTDRFAPFLTYLARQLGVKVTLRIANDYAAVIEGQRAGNVQIAYYGPASFSRALMTGVKTTAFVIDVNSASCWNASPIRCNSGARCSGSSVYSGSPNSRTSPESGGNRPASVRSIVDLPQPEPPSKVRISPRRTSRLTPSSTGLS